jgi:hypothetical protein
MGDHEDQDERQEGDYERRVQLVEFGQLVILLWGGQSWLQPAFSRLSSASEPSICGA